MQGLSANSPLANIARVLPERPTEELPHIDGVRYTPTGTGLTYFYEMLCHIFGLDGDKSADKQEKLRADICTLYQNLNHPDFQQNSEISFQLSDGQTYQLQSTLEDGSPILRLTAHRNPDQSITFEEAPAALQTAIKKHFLQNAANYVSHCSRIDATDALDGVGAAILDEVDKGIPKAMRQEAIDDLYRHNAQTRQFARKLIDKNRASFKDRKFRSATTKIINELKARLKRETRDSLTSWIRSQLSKLNLRPHELAMALDLIYGKFKLTAEAGYVESILDDINFEEVMREPIGKFSDIQSLVDAIVGRGTLITSRVPQSKQAETLQKVVAPALRNLTDSEFRDVVHAVDRRVNRLVQVGKIDVADAFRIEASLRDLRPGLLGLEPIELRNIVTGPDLPQIDKLASKIIDIATKIIQSIDGSQIDISDLKDSFTPLVSKLAPTTFQALQSEITRRVNDLQKTAKIFTFQGDAILFAFAECDTRAPNDHYDSDDE